MRGEGEHIDVIIGTHALLQKGVTFEKPGLMITDEQHRFGVMQRAELQEKSRMTHLLVMSATPIPRTLALAIYGDLSVSKLDEMPPGRQRVDTYVVDSSFKTRLHAFMLKQIEAGGQVYVVCPSIGLKNTEDDQTEEFEEVYLEDILSSAQERSPLKDAISYAKNLAEDIFPEFKVALLHGQMKSQEKDYVMAEFSQGKIDILVSTTVIEVGVNVPNATLMIVENAERFGLSQLHQLRGRVGRGRRKSYCVLVSDCKGENAIARLSTMKQCYDGYQIAEKDLEFRGPGDFFASLGDNAVRQSGGLSLKLARCCSDANLLSQAFAAGHLLLKKDPHLSLPEHQALAREVARVFTLESTTIS